MTNLHTTLESLSYTQSIFAVLVFAAVLVIGGWVAKDEGW